MDPTQVFVEMMVAAILLIVLPVTIYAMLSAGRPRQVECPVTHQLVQVRLEPGHMAGAIAVGTRHLVHGCSRWPGAAGCDRACEASLPGAA